MALTGLTPGALATQPFTTQTSDKSAGFGGLKTEDFVKILITELQSQSPLDPTDNSKLIEQIGAINNLSTTTKLNDSLQNLSSAQNQAAASALVGRNVTGTIDDKTVTGVVQKVESDNGKLFLMIGDQKLPLDQVQQIAESDQELKVASALNGLSLVQGLGSASALIGKNVTGDTDGGAVTGVVEKALVANGTVFLQVGGQQIPLSQITEVDPS